MHLNQGPKPFWTASWAACKIQALGFWAHPGGPHTEGRKIAPGSVFVAVLLQAGLRCAQGTQNYEAQPRKDEAQPPNPAAQPQNHEAQRLQGPKPRSLAPSKPSRLKSSKPGALPGPVLWSPPRRPKNGRYCNKFSEGGIDHFWAGAIFGSQAAPRYAQAAQNRETQPRKHEAQPQSHAAQRYNHEA